MIRFISTWSDSREGWTVVLVTLLIDWLSKILFSPFGLNVEAKTEGKMVFSSYLAGLHYGVSAQEGFQMCFSVSWASWTD